MEAALYFNTNVVRYVEDESGHLFAKVNLGNHSFLRLYRNTDYIDPVFILIGVNVWLDSARLFDNFLELNFKEVMEEGDLFQRWIRVIVDGDAKQLYEAYHLLSLDDACELKIVDNSDDLLDPDDFSRDED